MTLIGPGGVGKTRLAQAAVQDAVGSFPDGVVTVLLAALQDHQLVASSIAQALGMHESDGRPIAEILAGYLRTRRTLLLLDNFEQVVEAAASGGVAVGRMSRVEPGGDEQSAPQATDGARVSSRAFGAARRGEQRRSRA